MQWIASLWAWCNATSLHAYIAIIVIGILGMMGNAIIRWATPRWPDWAKTNPRKAGLLLFLKGFFPEGAAMARGAAAVLTGTLQARLSGAPAVPLAIIRERVEVIINEKPKDEPPAGGAA